MDILWIIIFFIFKFNISSFYNLFFSIMYKSNQKLLIKNQFLLLHL